MRQTGLLIAFGFITCVSFRTALADPEYLNVTPSATAGSKTVLLVNESSDDATLSATGGPPTNLTEGATLNPAIWGWSVYKVEWRAKASDSWTETSGATATWTITNTATSNAKVKFSFTGAGWWRVWVMATVDYSDTAGKTWHGPAPSQSEDAKTKKLEFEVVSVSLAAAPDSGWLLAGGEICLNAQSSYQSAKFRATIMPKDTSATVTLLAGSVANDVTVSPSSASDNGIVTASGGNNWGSYGLKIKHNDRADCVQDYELIGAVFFIDISLADPQASPSTSGTGAEGGQWYCKVTTTANNTTVSADVIATRYAHFVTFPSGYNYKISEQVKFSQEIQDKSSGYGVKVYDDTLDPNDSITSTIQVGELVVVQWAHTPSVQPTKEVAAFNCGLRIISSANQARDSVKGKVEVVSNQLVSSHVMQQTVGASMTLTQEEKSTYVLNDSTSIATCKASLVAAAEAKDVATGLGWVDAKLAEPPLADIKPNGSSYELVP